MLDDTGTTLEQFTRDFARAIVSADAAAPQAESSRTDRIYKPGIGPHSEGQTIRLVAEQLRLHDPERYVGLMELEARYPNAKRAKCDIRMHGRHGWAIEVKMLRFLGDNGKPNDNMLMHLLSPYPRHRSALTDCSKLRDSGFPCSLAVVVYGYDYTEWPMEPAIEAFEVLVRQQHEVSARLSAQFDGLIHPVHQRGRVFAWEIHRRH